MKVTDYIISFLVERKITDIFGYPGGMICHLMDSANKYSDQLTAHITYHEQGASFAACGYAMASGKVGVCYSTSGPGATNLVTGIANAYFDNIPIIFFTGQVDSFMLKGDMPIRQRGFQETDIISIVQPITKYAVRIEQADDIRYELEKAYYLAVTGAPGPVLLDLPADIQRAEVEIENIEGYELGKMDSTDQLGEGMRCIADCYARSNRPCLLLGNGVKIANKVSTIRNIIQEMQIPTVFSMPAFDVLPYEHEQNYGFIGSNGQRYANFVLGKSDLIIVLGSRLDIRQVGGARDNFVPEAQIIRVDIDKGNLSYKVHENEVSICEDLKELLPEWEEFLHKMEPCTKDWVSVCKHIRNELAGYDHKEYHKFIADVSETIPDGYGITTDVGQSQVWIAQAFRVKKSQKVFMSAGHGAMGFSLPAALGVYYATHKPVICFSGDGGIQMNIQELEFVKREQIPIKVVIINNHALGMIREFQEAHFEKKYVQTIEGKGYSVPNFILLAKAYSMDYYYAESVADINIDIWEENRAAIIELNIVGDTALEPLFGKRGSIQDQRPYLSRIMFERLMNL